MQHLCVISKWGYESKLPNDERGQKSRGNGKIHHSFTVVLQLIWPSVFASADVLVVKKRQSDLRRPVKLNGPKCELSYYTVF